MANLAPKRAPPLPPALEPPLPGTARLGLASAYFTLTWTLGAFATAAIAIIAVGSALRGNISTLTPPIGSVLALAGLTASAFLTSRLLERRSRLGALTATLWFIIDAGGYVAGDTDPLTLALSLVGLGVVGSVWNQLR